MLVTGIKPYKANIKLCRGCRFWTYVGSWKGNCTIRPWRKLNWSQSATACEDYNPSFHTTSYLGSGAGVSKPCLATNVVGYVEGF